MGRGSAASLAPGFRFHPTDEELVRYYLKRKVCGKSFRFDAISDVDVYKSEPWDLPDKSKLKTRDLEWYYFSVLDKKYGNGSRTNRATEKGYWKTTGKDRAVYYNSRTVGMKKTLVFHIGRAPRGERSNWVMHEYRLVDEELEAAGVVQDAFVLCRIFQKSGTGPKNGEQYGAPFIEEEWDEDEVVVVPGEQVADEVDVCDDAYVEANDLEQKLDISIPPENAPLPMNFYHGDNSNYTEDSRNFIDENQKPLIGTREVFCGSELPNGQEAFGLPEQYEMDTKLENADYLVKSEYLVESTTNVNPVEDDYLLDEPYFDATDNLPFDDGFFLETNDLSEPVEAGPSSFGMLEEYLAYFDADDDKSQYLNFDLSEIIDTENAVSDQAFLDQKHVDEGAMQMPIANQQLLKDNGNDGASSSTQIPEAEKFDTDFQYPFVKKATRMLGNIHAPPAFASEFPTKDAALRLAHAAQSSNSVAGMIQIRNTSLSGNGVDWSFGKNGTIDLVLCFALPQGDANSTSFDTMASLLSGKTISAMSRSWFYLMFFWVLILSVSYTIGSCVYTR